MPQMMAGDSVVGALVRAAASLLMLGKLMVAAVSADVASFGSTAVGASRCSALRAECAYSGWANALVEGLEAVDGELFEELFAMRLPSAYAAAWSPMASNMRTPINRPATVILQTRGMEATSLMETPVLGAT